MKISKNFSVEEFIPKELYNTYGDLTVRYINPKLVAITEIIREFYGYAVVINDWSRGGDRDGCALRLPSDASYKITSDHNYNFAIDFKVEGVADAIVQKDVIENKRLNQKLIDAGVTGVEVGTVGWTHLTTSDLTKWAIPEKNGIKLIPVPIR